MWLEYILWNQQWWRRSPGQSGENCDPSTIERSLQSWQHSLVSLMEDPMYLMRVKGSFPFFAAYAWPQITVSLFYQNWSFGSSIEVLSIKWFPGSLSLWPSHKSLKYSTAIKGRDEKLKGTDIKVGTYFSKHVKQLVIFILHLEISSGYKLLHLSLNWFPGKQNICLCTITQPPVSENRHKYPSSQSLVFNKKKNGMNGWCLTHRILCVYSAFGESSPPTTLPTLSWI